MDTFSDSAHPHATHEVRVPAGTATIHADLTIPISARGLVLFAHGSGSSRFSRRNRWVASELHNDRLATLLVDLLTDEEASLDERTGELRFDIQLLAQRVIDALDWIVREPRTGILPIGLFGASTGAAAALIAAVNRPRHVHAVVSRGGRPDLAASALPLVKAPTLLIVGGNDPDVLALNRAALARLKCDRKLEIVPTASHLFEEPGTLGTVAALARKWFVRHLDGVATPTVVGGGW
jgi:pimeloyl-ACP methyl ester carboxylesterase